MFEARISLKMIVELQTIHVEQTNTQIKALQTNCPTTQFLGSNAKKVEYNDFVYFGCKCVLGWG